MSGESTTSNRRAVSSKEAACYLGVSDSALRKQRMDGDRNGRMALVPYVRANTKILYLYDDLDAWLELHRVGGRAA